MNYEPNTKPWQFGDVVIHDADAKEWKMLMHVIKVEKNGDLTTAYLFPDVYYKGCPPRKFYTNEPKYLHDPTRFGIVIPSDQPQGGWL